METANIDDNYANAEFSSAVNLHMSSTSDGEQNEKSGVDLQGVEKGVNDETVMIGVEVFDESDVDADNNRLQFYSDTEIVSDPLLNSSDNREAVEFILESANDHPIIALPITATKKSTKKNKSCNNREPARLSLEDRIKCIRMSSRYDSFADVQKAWRQMYGTEPPCRKTLSVINKKFQRTGSVADLVRTGRPKSTRTEEVVAMVEETIRQDPSKSVRTIAKELGINHASVFRIRKDFEDKRNTLKMENRKLKDSLNDALKRITILERRLTKSLNEGKDYIPNGLETMVITTPSGEETEISTSQFNGQANVSTPTIIALNSTNGQISIPSVLRLQQTTGQETIHILTLPQGSSHHLLSLDESPVQLSMAAATNEHDIKINSIDNTQQEESCTVPSISNST